jgi:hypothetical protein
LIHLDFFQSPDRYRGDPVADLLAPAAPKDFSFDNQPEL